MAAKRKAIPEEFVPLFVRYRRDRAIRSAGNDGELMYLRALAHARDNDTEGLIEDFDLHDLAAGMGDPDAVVAKLVKLRLWVPVEGGWLIRSWDKWNPRGASESGSYGNHVKWHEQRSIVNPECRFCPDDPGESAPEIIGSDRVASPPMPPDDRPRIAPDIAPESPRGIANLAEVEGEVEGEGEERKEMVSADAPTLLDAPTPTEYTAEFETWWRLYPSKTGKRAAFDAWRKAKRKATVEALTIGVQQYARTRRVREGVIKNGSTWLNQECWLDEPEPQRISNPSGVDWDAAASRAAERERSAS